MKTSLSTFPDFIDYVQFYRDAKKWKEAFTKDLKEIQMRQSKQPAIINIEEIFGKHEEKTKKP